MENGLEDFMGRFEKAQERWVAGKRERGLPLDIAGIRG